MLALLSISKYQYQRTATHLLTPVPIVHRLSPRRSDPLSLMRAYQSVSVRCRSLGSKRERERERDREGVGSGCATIETGTRVEEARYLGRLLEKKKTLERKKVPPLFVLKFVGACGESTYLNHPKSPDVRTVVLAKRTKDVLTPCVCPCRSGNPQLDEARWFRAIVIARQRHATM